MKGRVSRCRSCGAAIIWATVTPSGKTMPVDAEPHPEGTVRWHQDGGNVVEVLGGELLATVREIGAAIGAMHRSHFATCPNAAAHRKPTAKAVS